MPIDGEMLVTMSVDHPLFIQSYRPIWEMSGLVTSPSVCVGLKTEQLDLSKQVFDFDPRYDIFASSPFSVVAIASVCIVVGAALALRVEAHKSHAEFMQTCAGAFLLLGLALLEHALPPVP